MAKGNKAPVKTVDDYLQSQPENVRLTLEKLRQAIRAAAPQAEEVISYGIPSFKYNGGLVGFGAASKHCAFYVMSPSVMKEFSDELEGYDTSPGAIRFPQDKALPGALVKKLVKARLKENEEIVSARAKKKATASKRK
jgi:uncharacterized protein YdhG (YjbR/CyaY superfamily)